MTPNSVDDLLPWSRDSEHCVTTEQGIETLHPPEIQSFYHCNSNRKMPRLDEGCRKVVHRMIAETGWGDSYGAAMDDANTLLSLDALQSYSNSFFSDFNDSMPIVHRPTFQPRTTEPLLLLVVLLVGAATSSQAATRLAMSIYDVLPGLVLQQHASSGGSERWRMQALLLLECLGRLRGNQQQLDIAHVYHTLLVQYVLQYRGQPYTLADGE